MSDASGEYDARKEAALGALAEGDPERAFREFRAVLADGYGEAPSVAQLADGLGVLARIIVAMGDRELAERCAAGSVGIGDDAVLYELGYQLIDGRAHV